MQSDTSPEAQTAYFEALKKLGPLGRLHKGLALSAFTRQVSEAGIRARHPEYSDEDVQWALRRLIIGDPLFSKAWPNAPRLDP